MQHRRVAIGDSGKLVQPAAPKSPETLEVWRQAVQDLAGQIDRQQIPQAAIRRVEIHPGAIGCDPVRADTRPVVLHCSPGSADLSDRWSNGDRHGSQAQRWDAGFGYDPSAS